MSNNEALTTQLAELNSRVRTHIQALWQISFAYLGLIALVFGFGGSSFPMPKLAYYFLIIIGVLVIWAMIGWRKGTKRGVKHIQRVELELELKQTAKTDFWFHELPHFLLVFSGIGAIVYMNCSG